MNDDRLIASVAEGDHTALRELFDRHAPWLAARLRPILPPGTVEDVLQETFIAVWRGADSYAGTGEVGGWVWGIARRQAALWARRHGRPELRLELLDVASIEDPAMTAVRRADLAQAFSELGSEGSDRRMLADLIFVEDRPLAEVARRFGIPEGTVKSRVHALRRVLRVTLRRGSD